MDVATQTGQSGLFVQAFVNNRSAKLLMDTGATLSIVAPHVVPDIKVDDYVPYIFLADGSPLKIKGTTTLSITIDGVTMQEKVVVAEIAVDGILGLDFMKSNACMIDVANKTTTLGGKTIELNLEGTIGCYRVRNASIRSRDEQSCINGSNVSLDQKQSLHSDVLTHARDNKANVNTLLTGSEFSNLSFQDKMTKTKQT